MGVRRLALEFIHEIIDPLGEELNIMDIGNTYIKGNAIDYIKENYMMENFS